MHAGGGGAGARPAIETGAWKIAASWYLPPPDTLGYLYYIRTALTAVLFLTGTAQ